MYGIKHAIELAKNGMTREEIMTAMGVNEEEYKRWLGSFSAASRRAFINALISSGIKNHYKKIKCVVDVSYVTSRFFRFDEVTSNTVILPSVFERIKEKSTAGNKAMYKLLDLIHKQIIKPAICPLDNKKDSFFEELKDIATDNVVVYTCDRRVANFCRKEKITYKFFDRELGARIPFNLDKSGKLFINDNRYQVVVADENGNKVELKDGSPIVCKSGYSVTCGGKSYGIVDTDGILKIKA